MKYRIREQNELKPSGVEWLGDIPKEWELTKIKRFIVNLIGGVWGNNEENNENDVICLRVADIDYDKLVFNENNFTVRNISNTELKSRILKKNDLVIEKSGGGEKTPVGRVVLYDLEQKAVCSNFMNKISVDNQVINSKFLVLIFNSLYSQRVVLESIKQTTGIQNLDVENYISNYISYPNILEQQKIANFLDEKSKIFDKAISKKEQLISKLEFAKQSLISEVVTGKLKIIEQNSKLQSIKREENELKPSGVEWLGDIPKDWQVKKSKYLFEIRKRISGTLGFDVLSITQKGIKIKDIETGGGQLSMDYSKYQIVNIGDFAMNHMDLLTGFVDIAKSQGVTSPDYRVFSLVDKNSDSIYYLYLFQMGYKNQIFFAFGQGSSQLGRWRFPTEEFNKFYFPYPSLEEQQKISKYLDEKLIHFDNTIEKTKQSIKKLKLAKEALISQAVTGKIEVL